MSCVLNLLYLIKQNSIELEYLHVQIYASPYLTTDRSFFMILCYACFTDIDSTHRHLVRTNEVAPVIIKNCNEEYQHVTEFTEPIVYGRIAEHLPEHPLIKVEGVTKCVYMGFGEGRGVGGACHLQNTADVLNISVCSK